jgi:hypothetical protein
VARHAYKSEKRRKETARLKKQEEKRQRRFAGKVSEEGSDTEMVESEGIPGEQDTAAENDSTEVKKEDVQEGA